MSGKSGELMLNGRTDCMRFEEVHFSYMFRVLFAFLVFSVLGTLSVWGQVPEGTSANGGVATSVPSTQDDAQKSDSVVLPPLGSYNRETISQKLYPIPYTYVREADVLWSKIIWRSIDLRQKLNFPLYYPTVRMQDRKSVTQTLYDAIMEREITAYDPDLSLTSPGDEFVTPLTPAEAKERLSGADIVQSQLSMTTGQDSTWVIPAEINWNEIKQILVKEEWFFDSRRSVMEVRIIGLCPVREYYEDLGGDAGQLRRMLVWWIYYPEARNALAREAFFNPKNDAQAISYDDLFFKRRFGSTIIRETNEYNNRAIADYKVGGVPIMREADRIYNEIFNKEQDLWEY